MPPPNSNSTPQKRTTTPSKSGHYAGPTFHASPAPSSLPIPRMFSKSVPNASALDGLKSTKEESSDDSAAPSPSPQPAALAAIKKEPPRNASPLDIFFRADREEKARAASAGTNTPSSLNDQSRSQANSPAYRGTPSPTPANLNRGRQFQGANQSPNEMFALEMEGSAMQHDPRHMINQAKFVERHGVDGPHIASGGVESDDEEARRQAKTQALKDLLWSPRGSRPASSAARFDSAQEITSSLPASPSPQVHGQNGRAPLHKSHGSNSGVMSYDTFSNPTNPLPSHRKNPSQHKAQGSRSSAMSYDSFSDNASPGSATNRNPPRTQNPQLTSTTGSPAKKKRASKLRKEVTPSKPVTQPVQAGPTLSAATDGHARDIETISRTNLEAHISNAGQAFLQPQLTPSDNAGPGPTASVPPRSEINVQSMEADLRRMLNMGSAGVGTSRLPKDNGA